MTFRGIIRNGQIEVDPGIDLPPEGTRVSIEPTGRKVGKRARPRATDKDPAFSIGDRAIPMGVADLAAEHDHYLYGTPKRAGRTASTGRAKPARARKSAAKPGARRARKGGR